MRYVCWGLIGLAALAVVIALICLWGYCHRKRAIRKVRCESEEKKICSLNGALSVFGFEYWENCDCIVSAMDSWQRDMGYCEQYDRAAPAMNIIMDCEPIYFRYDGKNWLLELWKGQYGCAAGAEMGIYYNEEKDAQRPEKLFYTCADDSKRLNMEFSLWQGERLLLKRCGLHWWLTGFLPGKWVRPRDLIMKACIWFPNVSMAGAFCKGLRSAGYRPAEIYHDKNRVCFIFDSPRTKQPSGYGRICRSLILWKNRLSCRWYLKVSRPFCSTLDRISFLCCCFPRLYRKLTSLGASCSPGKYERCKGKKIF